MIKNIFYATFILFIFVNSYQCLAGDIKYLQPDEWPISIEATVQDILAHTTKEYQQLLRETAKEDLFKYHHGWGTGIRNYYGLWRGNKKLIKSVCGRPCPPDDASMIIMEAVWKELQN